MNTGYWAFIRTLASYGLAMAFIIGLSGCEESYTEAECWDLRPKDVNEAEGMAVVETARTEAATEAKIKIATAALETFMILGMIGCVGGAFLGKFFNSKIATRLCIIGILVFGTGWALMATKIQYPKVMAIAGLVMVLSVIATFVVVVILNRRALQQVVEGGDRFKERVVASPKIDKSYIKAEFNGCQEIYQESTANKKSLTAKIVDKIRKVDK